MSRLLIMLSPPRSFSSVISTMLGEHPDLYGFPELHIFTGDTLGQVVEEEASTNRRHAAGPPGLIRAVAQLQDGLQTTGSCLRAISWIHDHRSCTVRQVMDDLLAKVSPRIGIEKSPVTAQKKVYLERAYAAFPDAFFLHLTRHPVSNRASWDDFITNKANRKKGDEGERKRMDRYLGWHHMHTNILQFTNTLPLGQSIRIKGEDLLSEPDVYLPQICEWMGIRTSQDALEAMKHPERSPYACVGPEIARGGNDPKFMRSPALRPGRVKEPSLVDTLQKESPDWFPQGRFREAAHRSGLKIADDHKIKDQIMETAHILGYL